MRQFQRPLIALVLSLLSAQPALAQGVRWTTYRNASGTTVPFPAELFTTSAGEGTPRGDVFTSTDGRARLHVFALTNERSETPAQFIRRVIVDNRRTLTYERVTRNFFVFSAPEDDRVLYRRCNFARDSMITASTCAIRVPRSARSIRSPRG